MEKIFEKKITPTAIRKKTNKQPINRTQQNAKVLKS